ncbi:MAG: PDZ domain-containing protein [Planctomycetes bacterium]|nr:PDZ domain-containing protein [Planctomycetota bacterium]
MVRQDSEIERLEREFVCVRVVQMKGVDLRTFQFDYDQTWAAFFLNADGSIYGRYGTRAGGKEHATTHISLASLKKAMHTRAGGKEHATTHISLASLKKAMQRALELHRGYPANKAQLAGKLGQQPEYQYAEQIPTAVAKAKQRHCIHCHNVTEDLRQTKYEQKRLAASDIWVYPLPENVGLKMDVDDGLRVEVVTPESPAAQAGILAGDELVTMNGQRLISQADIQWVLHHAPAKGQVTVTLNRGGQLLRETIVPSGRWKETDLSWRESSWALRPGLWTLPLSEAEKREKGIPGDALGLFVKWVPPRATLAKQAGLRDGDVIVAVDGQTAPMNESQFIAYVRLHHLLGDTVALTLLRGDRREDVKMQVE